MKKDKVEVEKYEVLARTNSDTSRGTVDLEWKRNAQQKQNCQTNVSTFADFYRLTHSNKCLQYAFVCLFSEADTRAGNHYDSLSLWRHKNTVPLSNVSGLGRRQPRLDTTIDNPAIRRYCREKGNLPPRRLLANRPWETRCLNGLWNCNNVLGLPGILLRLRLSARCASWTIHCVAQHKNNGWTEDRRFAIVAAAVVPSSPVVRIVVTANNWLQLSRPSWPVQPVHKYRYTLDI
ncbi:hypothetical protein J6590_036104 [Homalodisca vitripennis]|nr:hypothetical protein J6590_036104 [Homalodisca vitripennis]